MPKFLLTYPVYAVLDREGNAFVPLHVKYPNGLRALAIFTEPLFAERCRDVWRISAKLHQIENNDDFLQLLQQSVGIGLDHVTIDPPEEPGKGKVVLVSINEIKRSSAPGV